MNLQDIRKIRLNIDFIKERIEILDSAKEYGEALLRDGGKSNYPEDKMARIVAELDVLKTALMDAALEYELEAQNLEAMIASLPETERNIAHARHVKGLSWKEVSRETHYAEGYCRNIGMALSRKI